MILAINTATMQFSLALVSESGSTLAEHVMSEERGHFGRLMPTLDFLLASSGKDIGETTCISVATGPGSFTGLRIGLSLAKGLCHALHIPIIGIPSLEAMAAQASCSDLPVIPLLYSRKQEAFTARFVREKKGHLRRIDEDTWVRFDDIPRLISQPVLFVGNDYPHQGPLLRDLVGEQAVLAPPHAWCLRASAIGSLAAEKYVQGDTDDPHLLNPVYLRPPDIRPNPFAHLNSSARGQGQT
jgi:tRNA threonylcarbamoyladenosine biosynthesis protein TsaB